MSTSIRKLKPQALWNAFADLNAIPRPSKKETKVVRFMQNFGRNLGLETYVDKTGNVIIRKPAAKGLEHKPAVILQGHLDMVAQKNEGTDFDFEKSGIQMTIDKGWVTARGTTLGADNGIGVAAIMAVLADKKSKYPAIEALFTVDEETGMTGAFNLKPGLLKGQILLNLDSEDEEEMTIGCAGGVDVNISKSFKMQTLSSAQKLTSFSIVVKGLKGGHSGMDIHLGRGNANKILNRIFLRLQEVAGIRINKFDGGGLRNAIPREAKAVVTVKEKNAPKLVAEVEDLTQVLKKEFAATDPELNVLIKKQRTNRKVWTKRFQTQLLYAIQACFNGIYRMSPDVEGLVQTSNNLARVLAQNGKLSVACLTRSAVDSEKMDCAETVAAPFRLIGCEVKFTGSYPGWAPEPNAKVNKLLERIYKKKFKKRPKITACHAGLECGILKKAYPEVEMISFGPNIRGAHSPDERVEIESVARFYELLQDVLLALAK